MLCVFSCRCSGDEGSGCCRPGGCLRLRFLLFQREKEVAGFFKNEQVVTYHWNGDSERDARCEQYDGVMDMKNILQYQSGGAGHHDVHDIDIKGMIAEYA